jgi:TRAP-type C4-dicarboxylate transport system permease small subunit
MVKILNEIEEKFLILNLLFSTIIVFANVVLRYCFSASLHWIDEAARYLFLWLIWVGADFAYRENRHLRIGMIADNMKGRPRFILEVIVQSFWFAFCVFLGYQGVRLVLKVAAQNQLSTAMQINMGWAYACVPCGVIFMALRLASNIVELLRSGKFEETA